MSTNSITLAQTWSVLYVSRFGGQSAIDNNLIFSLLVVSAPFCCSHADLQIFYKSYKSV